MAQRRSTENPRSRGARRLLALGLVTAGAVVPTAVWLPAASPRAASANPCGPNIFVPAQKVKEKLRMQFLQSSYAPNSRATLEVTAAHGGLAQVGLFKVGPGPAHGPRGLTGASVAAGAPVVLRRGTHRLGVEVGDWPSGLYFARMVTREASAFAVFVVRAQSYSDARVAVVVPTLTWAAYNFRDSDGNGYGDTWYRDPRVHTVALRRPFLNGGVPQSLRRGGFNRWVAEKGYDADFYADEDFDRVPTAADLASRYDLIVFGGHAEYVTEHMFKLVERFRNAGGNLAFMSANTLYRRVVVAHGRMTCIDEFRELGQPEASIIGVQYVDWDRATLPNAPYVVRSTAAAPWLFRGTGLRPGHRFGFGYGIEIDARAPSSPPGTHVLAELPRIFGPGKTAQMTYYRTRRGAKVFAAGAMNFEYPQSRRTDLMLENLWAYLETP